MTYANYLPDELLLEILNHFTAWETVERQTALARFSAVNRQWYDVAIQLLYESPYLFGSAYELFVRTISPSVLARIKPTSLSSLVIRLDLSHIVHQGNKSTTARLLGRTKASLQEFIAPQASFAINCWASLSKCSRLRVLDLSLVSECIDFQSLNQALRQLTDLRELCLPRCSSRYEKSAPSTNLRWPPKLGHLSLSGSVSGSFLWDMRRQPNNFPPTFSSLGISHSPGLDHQGIQSLLCSLGATLTVVQLHDLPAVKQGRLNGVLDWLPSLVSLTVALDYIDMRFGHMPTDFQPARWREAKPLRTLTLVTSGRTGDPSRSFTATDLYAMIDERFLGRLRYLNIAQSTDWANENEGDELGALESLLVEELDKENWLERRWHYEEVPFTEMSRMSYEQWISETATGRKMRPRFKVLKR
ncbi:hypothetical protein BDW02DRAFT_488890 [Decorospora gaudefroyi]|uniref:F-box domain-containing protein n=1 Tax=Decorospora gaudefroyi TaxID=184978 RepID=A0A6A5KQV1_9PLEO|nr:hypothetical protein BDW02DRAFT_488890 [Decorospora gaudefroyi]